MFGFEKNISDNTAKLNINANSDFFSIESNNSEKK